MVVVRAKVDLLFLFKQHFTCGASAGLARNIRQSRAPIRPPACKNSLPCGPLPVRLSSLVSLFHFGGRFHCNLTCSWARVCDFSRDRSHTQSSNLGKLPKKRRYGRTGRTVTRRSQG